MTEGKGWGKTVLGWFVVQEGQGSSQDQGSDFGSPTVDPSLASGDAPQVPLENSALADMPQVFEKAPPQASGGNVDFDAVFDAAGIGAEDHARVTKSLDLLQSLPADTDPNVKKQIVGASLKAFGVPIEKIIETGVAEIQALEGYIREGAAKTSKMADESEALVKDYESKIAEIRKIVQEQVESQQTVMKRCNEKKLEVQQILEFFGQDAVAKVVRESPKLHEPAKKS